MNKRQAAAVRAAQLRGEPVKAIDLQEAIAVLGSKRSNRMSLPGLRDDVRQRGNLVLMFNLGRAIGQ
jgi:hypothetical protein